MAEHRALVVIDTQVDFCEGGSLPVPGGREVARNIGHYIAKAGGATGDFYRVVVASRDHHVDPGPHFSETPDFVDSWPPHCVAGTVGAEFAPELDTTGIRHVFYKGMLTAAYSAFQGVADLLGKKQPPYEGDVTYVSLENYLRQHEITILDLVGIELRNCVKATALDAVLLGFKTRVLRNLVASLGGPEEEVALKELADAGVTIT